MNKSLFLIMSLCFLIPGVIVGNTSLSTQQNDIFFYNENFKWNNIAVEENLTN